jgi:hypothetical protein
MLSLRIKSKLAVSGSSNYADSINQNNELQNQSKTLPDYAIALISVSCTLLMAVLIYLLYHKIKKKPEPKNGKTKRSGPIREVWANPDIDNINDIISWDRNKGLNAKRNSSSSLRFNRSDSSTSSPYESDLIEFNNTIQ